MDKLSLLGRCPYYLNNKKKAFNKEITNVKQVKKEPFSFKEMTNSMALNLLNGKYSNINLHYSYNIDESIRSRFWRAFKSDVSSFVDFSNSMSIGANYSTLNSILNSKVSVKNEIKNYINTLINNIAITKKYHNLFEVLFEKKSRITFKERVLDSIDLLILDCLNRKEIVSLLNCSKGHNPGLEGDVYLRHLLEVIKTRLVEDNSLDDITGATDLRDVTYKVCIFSCEMYKKLWPNFDIEGILGHLNDHGANLTEYHTIKLKLRLYIGFMVDNMIFHNSNKVNEGDLALLLDDLLRIVSDHEKLKNNGENMFFIEIILLLLSRVKFMADMIPKFLLLLSKFEKIGRNFGLMGDIVISVLRNDFITQCESKSSYENHYKIDKVVLSYLSNEVINLNSASSGNNITEIISNIIENNTIFESRFNNKESISRLLEVLIKNIVRKVLECDTKYKYREQAEAEAELLLKLMDKIRDNDKHRILIRNRYFLALDNLIRYIHKMGNESICKTDPKKVVNNYKGVNYHYLLWNEEYNKQSNKTNYSKLFLNFIKKMNSMFVDLNGKNCDLSVDTLLNIVNYFDLITFIQKELEFRKGNDIDWSIVNEGVNLINNCISLNYDNNINISVDKVDDVLQMSNSLIENLKEIFDKIKSGNNDSKKTKVPDSRVYFEILRLIHNLNVVKIGYDKDIKLIPQGLVPLNTVSNIKNNEDPDFLSEYVNNMLINTDIDGLVQEKSGRKTNLILIHGFLGSAFKSWNLDTSSNRVSVITADKRFCKRYSKSKKLSKMNIFDELKVSEENKRLLECLRNGNYLLWPKILLLDKNLKTKVRLFALDYSHKIFRNSSRRDTLGNKYCDKTTLNEISEEIYDKLMKTNIFTKKEDNIMICHSMGGILLKLILTNHPELIKNVKGIVFFGTPHFGADLNPKIVDILKERVSPYIIELSSTFNINQLRKLNLRFQKTIYSMPKNSRPLIYSFSEYLPSKIPFLFNLSKVIVPYVNSNPFIGNFYILNTDHNKVNKLTLDFDDLRYKTIKNLID